MKLETGRVTEVRGLLPCPFCGHTPLGIRKVEWPLLNSEVEIWMEIECSYQSCPASPSVFIKDTAAAAIQAWNTREG